MLCKGLHAGVPKGRLNCRISCRDRFHKRFLRSYLVCLLSEHEFTQCVLRAAGISAASCCR